jgi:AcrR family transcriptional regulator
LTDDDRENCHVHRIADVPVEAADDQILGAARELFLERGFAGTSMEAIREKAGVSKPTVYNYYPAKEELFVDVLRRHIDENFGDWLREEATSEDFPATREELRDVLRSLVERFFATLMRPEYLALMRVVISETPRFPHLGVLLKQMAPERMMELVSTLLKRADERGIAEIEDVDAARRMLIGPFITYVFLDGLLAGEPRPPEPERIESIIDLYMKVTSGKSG